MYITILFSLFPSFSLSAHLWASSNMKKIYLPISDYQCFILLYILHFIYKKTMLYLSSCVWFILFNVFVPMYLYFSTNEISFFPYNRVVLWLKSLGNHKVSFKDFSLETVFAELDITSEYLFSNEQVFLWMHTSVYMIEEA